MLDVKTGKVLFIEGRLSEAAEHFYECAREGDPEGAFNYAFCLQFGYGVKADIRQAVSYYKFAAGILGEANYNLAVIYLHGVGVEKDYKKCFEYMYEAARKDMIEAQLYLGVAHTMGMLFEPDIAALSLIPFHNQIPREEILSLEGDVPDWESDEAARIAAVRFDPVTAHSWFKRAAAHDSDYVETLATQSKFLYAQCFVDGLGTDYDRQKAEDLMLVAANDGSPDALKFLETNAPYRLPELKNNERLDLIRRVYRLGN